MSDIFYVNKKDSFLDGLVEEIEVRQKREKHLNEIMSKNTPKNQHPVRVGFKRLSDDAILPTKAHPTDSGYDLYANEDVIIEPGETKVIPTGIAVKLPAGYEAQVRPRSGVTSKSKLRVQLGTIDNGYTGEIGVIVDNIESRPNYFGKHKIRKGDRIAQLVVQPLPAVEAYEIEGDLEQTERGAGGFGSSGVRD